MGTTSRAISGCAAGVVVVLAAAGCTASETPSLAALERPATAQDTTPEGVSIGRGMSDTRYVGQAGDGLVYAARGTAEEPWCVVVVLAPVEGPGWVAGSSCTEDVRFARDGVLISVTGGDGRTATALLLPDDTGELDEGEWRRVEPNLAVPADA
ncbi:hypothetical protein [Actinotalea sp. K2]|uniref:hypothetical protein n=1 Tax=Actinotalea sp. K2 TaxID=2939438 RepID=UPI00201707AD|nr:hypothetical protein [Actinotalea sp. K2]MCL3859424.1 hypothetical protein [Actinotalea sp. K2]